jgi:hypothetical protein
LLQAWQSDVAPLPHAVSQHTLSTQNPEAHSPLPVQGAPLARTGPEQVPLTHLAGGLQAPSSVHVPSSHAVAPQA